jgi:predicted transposase/invertase (TIGR01784 family)
MTQEHDTGYKLLFAHPEMVRDLLIGFVPEPWVQTLDFSTLERVNASYVSDKGDARHEDMVWKVRFENHWLYVYLLLEFQAQPDRWMALRMLVYLGLLYQDLVRRNELTPEGKLPPVLPIVLYNGMPRWNAAEEIGELIAHGPEQLRRWQPQARYLLIDEGRYLPEELTKRNLAAALFRLEHSRSPEDMRRVVQELIEWLSEPEQKPLRFSLTRWLLRLLQRKMEKGTVEVPDVADLLEVDTMLAERIESWTKEWWEQGLEQGLQQGEEKGFYLGELQTLQRLLTKRFGPLPEAMQVRLSTASREEIERWLDRVLDAQTLDEVFG